MLLPALSKAKEKAREVSCQSNLKQLNVMFQNYVIDFKDWLPHRNNTNKSAASWINRMITDLKYISNNNTSFLICPSHGMSEQTRWYIVVQKNEGYINLLSYGYNEHLGCSNFYGGTAVPYLPSAKMTEVKTPASTILLGESRLGSDRLKGHNYLCSRPNFADSGNGFLRVSHQLYTNILWLDGHVMHYKVGSESTAYTYDPFRFGDSVGNASNYWDRK